MQQSNRRKFIKNTTGLIVTGIIGKPLIGNINKPQLESLSKNELIMRTLGRTGIKIPVVSMGVMNANNPNLIKAAYNAGIRHFDTAWVYQGGNNEKMIGNVLQEMAVNRHEVVIATKVLLDRSAQQLNDGNERKRSFLNRFSESLQRLQTDYIDILYYHDAWNKEQIIDPYIKEAFLQLKSDGKIKATGFSSHVYWPEIVYAAADDGFYDVMLLSFNYAMSNDNRSVEALKYAASKGMGLIAMKTQCQQAWYRQSIPAEAQAYYEGKIMHGALLKWVLSHDYITTTIPGFTTYEQLNEDITVAYDLHYTPDEIKFLEDHNIKTAMNSVCRFCGECSATCPYGVKISSLMRAHMYAASYGNYYMARITAFELEKNQGLQQCHICPICVATCRNSVNIAERLEELKIIMG
jgi:predicted aldo/keto reductase-like oxidoreductase